MSVAPYYQDKQVTVYLGDCREVCPRLRRESVDLVVTDPPYGVSFRSNFRQERFEVMAGDNDAAWVPAALTACLRVLRDHRHAYLFGRWETADLPLCAVSELIWDKANIGGGDLSVPWGPNHEPITFGVHGSRAHRDRGGGGALAARLRRGSVITCKRLSGVQVAKHPTEKPVMLLRQLIESSSVIGETVFDPFAGSGATLEAAVVEGRKAIGIEIDERYAEGIARRMTALAARVA